MTTARRIAPAAGVVYRSMRRSVDSTRTRCLAPHGLERWRSPMTTLRALRLANPLRVVRLLGFASVLGIIAASEVSARADRQQIGVQLVADGLVAPVDLTFAPDGSDRRFIVDQTGLVLVLKSDGHVRAHAVPGHHRPGRHPVGGSTSAVSSRWRSTRGSRRTASFTFSTVPRARVRTSASRKTAAFRQIPWGARFSTHAASPNSGYRTRIRTASIRAPSASSSRSSGPGGSTMAAVHVVRS